MNEHRRRSDRERGEALRDLERKQKPERPDETGDQGHEVPRSEDVDPSETGPRPVSPD